MEVFIASAIYERLRSLQLLNHPPLGYSSSLKSRLSCVQGQQNEYHPEATFVDIHGCPPRRDHDHGGWLLCDGDERFRRQ